MSSQREREEFFATFKSASVPDDAKIILLIMKSMGVETYDQNVVFQLLEFTHRMFSKRERRKRERD
jgi:Transcription initiation factor IID, 31kD subunit